MTELKTLNEIANDLRKNNIGDKKRVLIFAYNRVGKTRLSMEFKDLGKDGDKRDTLYFNAFTEDLFTWDNDLEGDSERFLKMNSDSRFLNGFKELNLESKIYECLERYVDFDFKINYDEWEITFSQGDADNIKISRGEQNIFIWCVFLVILQLILDEDESYEDIKYVYIDDPISSLDDGNTIAMACDLAILLKHPNNKQNIKTIISSHHGLFFHVLSKELGSAERYFLNKDKESKKYYLRKIEKKDFFYHVAMLGEIQEAIKTGKLYTYHFNIMRGILEKTALFFGFDNFSDCIYDVDDTFEKIYFENARGGDFIINGKAYKPTETFELTKEQINSSGIQRMLEAKELKKHTERVPKEVEKKLRARALNVFSHSNYPLYSPKEMNPENKELFKEIFDGFVKHYGLALFEDTQQETKT